MSAADCTTHILRYPLEKQAAIGKSGEHVVEGEIVELFPFFDMINRERNVAGQVRQ